MAQGLPRTRLNSARLVRILADLKVADAPASRQPFADRLGQWLDFNASLALFSAVNPGAASDTGAAASSADGVAAQQAFARVRGVLVDAITSDEVLDPGKTRIEPARAALHPSAGSAADFAPFHRCYLARQRDMNARIAPLRANVRAALSRQSPALKRLAVLDAVLDEALGARERDLLAAVPGLLGRRFEHLRAMHAETPTTDDPARRMEPGGWLATFCREMQNVLLAELELRLQPISGLIAAFDQEVGK